jgi:hypothetical protein
VPAHCPKQCEPTHWLFWNRVYSIIITECWCKIAGAICCLVSHSKARNNTQKYLSHPFPFVSVFPSLLWLHERSGLPLESGLSDWTVQADHLWPSVNRLWRCNQADGARAASQMVLPLAWCFLASCQDKGNVARNSNNLNNERERTG